MKLLWIRSARPPVLGIAGRLWLKGPMAPERQSAPHGAPGGLRISVRRLKTPVGVLHVAASDDKVLYIEFARRRGEGALERWVQEHLLVRSETAAMRAALAQLREYFAGKRRSFAVSLDPGGTEFQRRVWDRVAAIPFGEAMAYGDIADDLGDPRLARAVGSAVGANPIPIIIPCHRVIGADGSLTGYGGGLRAKVWLLHHEGALLT